MTHQKLELPDLLEGVPPLPKGGKLQVIGPHDIAIRAHLNGAYKKVKISTEAAAEKFIAENPKVWDAFVKFTMEAINAGHKRLGVDMVFGRLRWETMLKTSDPEGFKMNNNHKAPFARRFMRMYPQYEGFFQTRSKKDD